MFIIHIVPYPLVALCGMIVTLLDSSVSFFLFLLMGYLCLFLSQGISNEYIVSIFIFYCCKHFCLLANYKIIVTFLLVMKITYKSKRTNTNFE